MRGVAECGVFFIHGEMWKCHSTTNSSTDNIMPKTFPSKFKHGNSPFVRPALPSSSKSGETPSTVGEDEELVVDVGGVPESTFNPTSSKSYSGPSPLFEAVFNSPLPMAPSPPPKRPRPPPVSHCEYVFISRGDCSLLKVCPPLLSRPSPAPDSDARCSFEAELRMKDIFQTTSNLNSTFASAKSAINFSESLLHKMVSDYNHLDRCWGTYPSFSNHKAQAMIGREKILKAAWHLMTVKQILGIK